MGVPPAPGGAGAFEKLRLITREGYNLRAGIWRAETPRRGLALILPGRTEFLEKVAVPAAELTARGYDVASLDWRGQGRSERLLPVAEKGHVSDFGEYLRDLHTLRTALFQRGEGPVRLVLAHSMGAAIALFGAAGSRLPPAPMILSAPMVGIAMPRGLRAATGPVIRAAAALGRLDRWPPVRGPAGAYPLAVPFEENLLTGDRELFEWLRLAIVADPRLALGLPTLGWLRAARRAMARIAALDRLGTPALCLLGSEERVVDPEAVRRTAARLQIPCREIAGARHDLLIERADLRAEVWAEIDAFLAHSGGRLARAG